MKVKLRNEMRKYLRSIDPSQKKAWDLAIGNNIAQFLKDKKGIIGVYAPMDDEVNWTVSDWCNGVKLAFPKIESETEMSFYEGKLDELSEQKFGNLKLKIPSSQNSIACVPKIVFVPGLAFSRTGARLGRGRGYFDRYLACHKVVSVGLAYEGQLKDSVPVASNDWLMDFIITEKIIISAKIQAPQQTHLRR